MSDFRFGWAQFFGGCLAGFIVGVILEVGRLAWSWPQPTTIGAIGIGLASSGLGAWIAGLERAPWNR